MNTLRQWAALYRSRARLHSTRPNFSMTMNKLARVVQTISVSSLALGRAGKSPSILFDAHGLKGEREWGGDGGGRGGGGWVNLETLMGLSVGSTLSHTPITLSPQSPFTRVCVLNACMCFADSFIIVVALLF
jgi:hypothetical protein